MSYDLIRQTLLFHVCAQDLNRRMREKKKRKYTTSSLLSITVLK